jgi:hypothetical protein
MRRTPLRKVSIKRKAQNVLYLKRRAEFFARPENLKCKVFPLLQATDIHHMAGRKGDMLLDERFWLAVSREGHRWIHENPKKAMELGFIMKIGK